MPTRSTSKKKKKTPVARRPKRRRVRLQRVTPVVRPKLRNGRGAFLRALRGKIEKIAVTVPEGGYARNIRDYRSDIIQVLDAGIERYKGD